MTFQATAKHIHISTRKVRLVADAIRKLSPEKAVALLAVTPKNAAGPLRQVVLSALANAKMKGVAAEQLVFQTIEIMGGPAMKRWHAVSRGSAHSYKKRMTHIRIILKEKENGTKN
jgi:large subunit ribosomal protein L22